MGVVFLLSPAHCGGKRAGMLMRDGASFELAQRVRGEGAPIGEVFTFLSGLYFRGKIAYARQFARPPAGAPGILVITPNAGLLGPDEHVDVARLRKFAKVDIALGDARYERPLVRDAGRLVANLDADSRVVLLGSVATGKYVDVLCRIFGERLLFPRDFVGRGDMSRGGLMLRAADDRIELDYIPVAGAVRHGARPPKLPRRPPRAKAGAGAGAVSPPPAPSSTPREK